MAGKSLTCDTCGRQVVTLRRDVVDNSYNALSKPPLWNCEECYERKREERLAVGEQKSVDQ